jgi:hypothetical protein
MARPCLDRNVKYKTLIRVLGLPKPYVRGLLETMWDVANECGDPVLKSPESVEAAAEWPSDEEPGKLFAALRDCRLIDEIAPGIWSIHDYWDHAPEYVAGRSRKEAERKIAKSCCNCGCEYHSTETHSRFCSDSCRVNHHRGANRVTDGNGGLRNSNGQVTERYVNVTDSNAPPAPAPAPAPSLRKTPYSPPLLIESAIPEKYRKAFQPLTRWFTYLAAQHSDKIPLDPTQASVALCQVFGTCASLTTAIDLAIGNNWRSLKPEHGSGTSSVPSGHEPVDIPYPEY